MVRVQTVSTSEPEPGTGTSTDALSGTHIWNNIDLNYSSYSVPKNSILHIYVDDFIPASITYWYVEGIKSST